MKNYKESQNETDNGCADPDKRPSDGIKMIFAQIDGASDQDLGKPSPVPYSVMLRQPSADIDTAGRESMQSTSTHKDIRGAAAAAEHFAPIDGLQKFIRSAFDDYGVYRLEIVVGDLSIKVYKHPNN